MTYAYNVLISGCEFNFNEASALSKNIFLGFATVTISNTEFYDSES